MIKNVIFDIGGVLLKFNPENYLDDLKYPNEKAKILNKLVFKNIFWKDYLRGNISFKEYKEGILKNNELYENEICHIIDIKTVKSLMPPIKETFNLIKYLQKQNVKTFILSNIGSDSRDYFESLCNETTFNGCVYSCDVGLLKPEKEIYNLIIDRYNLNPEETLFVDDQEKNTIAAEECGLNTLVFKNTEKDILTIKTIIKDDYAK